MSEIKKQSNNLPVTPPEVIPGLEGIDRDMLEIPRVLLVQRSAQKVDTSEVKPGSLINSVTLETIMKFKKDGENQVTIQPVHFSQSRIKFNKFGDSNMFSCQSFDGKVGVGDPGGQCIFCPHSRFINNEPPVCDHAINVYCYIVEYDIPLPIVFQFRRTSMKTGKQLVNQIYNVCQKNKKSPWHYFYKIGTKEDKNDYGVFYVYTYEPAGDVSEEWAIQKGEDLHALASSTKVVIHAEHDVEDLEKVDDESESPEVNF